MAKRGNITKSIRSDISIYISWSALQNQSNNYSDVTATLYINRKHSMYSTGTGSITLSKTTKSGSYDISTSSGGLYKVCTITKRINHNQDGTASITLGGSVDFRGTDLSGTVLNVVTIANQTIQLDQIKRLAKVSISNFALATGITVPVTKYSTGSVDVVVYAQNTFIKSYGGVGNSFDLNFSEDELKKIYAISPNTASPKIKLEVYTHDKNGNDVGYISFETNATMPSDIKPYIGEITVTDSNSKNKHPNTLMQYISTWKLHVSDYGPGEGSKDDGLKWSLTSGGREFYDAWKNDTITPAFKNEFGDIKVTATAYDTRGRSTSTSIVVYLDHYRAPSISSGSAVRTDNTGKISRDGVYAKVDVSLRGTTISGENPLTVKVKKRASGDSSWTSTLYTETIQSLYWDAINNFSKVLSDFSISTDYEIGVELSDNYSSALWIGTIPSSNIPLAFSSSGVGIGGFPNKSEEAALQVYGDCAFQKAIKPIGGYKEIKAVLLNGWTGTLTYRKDGFGNAHIWGTLNPGTIKQWTRIASLGEEYCLKDVYTSIPTVHESLAKGARLKNALVVTEFGNLTVINANEIDEKDTVYINCTFHCDGGW